MSQTQRQPIYWQAIIELAIVMITVLGTTIPLYIHTDSKTKELVKELHDENLKMNDRTDHLYEMFINLLKEGRK